MRNRSTRFANSLLTILSMVGLVLAIGVGVHFLIRSPYVSAEIKAVVSMVALVAVRQLAAAIESLSSRTKAERVRRTTNRVAQKLDNLDQLEDRLTDKMGKMIRETVNEILTGPNGLEERISRRFDTFGKDVDAKFKEVDLKLEVMSSRIDKEIAASRHKADGTVGMLKETVHHLEGELKAKDAELKVLKETKALPPAPDQGHP